MNNDEEKERVQIGITKEDYKSFVINKSQDPPLLNRITRPAGPTELVCEVDRVTWVNFTLNYTDEYVNKLREQMATSLWSAHRDEDHNVLSTLKDVVINLMAEEIEHYEDEIRAIRHAQIDVEAESDMHVVLERFIRVTGLESGGPLSKDFMILLGYLHPDIHEF